MWNIYLVLLHGGVVLVTHGADLHAALPLPVPLAEELLHDAIRPLAVELQRLRGVAQVGAMHHVLQHLWRTDRERHLVVTLRRYLQFRDD